jgi:hypothetical protein
MSTMDTNINTHIKRKSMWYAILWSAVHLVCLPVVLCFTILSSVCAMNLSGIKATICLTLFFLVQLAPLSSLVSIFAIWICYFRRKYEGMYVFCGFPFIAYVVAVLLISVMDVLRLF